MATELFLSSPFLPQAAAFLFVFAVVYGLLATAGLFKKRNPVNIAIAAVFGLFSITNGAFVASMTLFIPIASIILIVLFFIVFIYKATKGDKEARSRDMLPLGVVLIILLALVAVFPETLQRALPFDFSIENLMWIAGIAIILLIFLVAYMHKEAS